MSASRLELKIPPPLVAATAGVLMWLASRATDPPLFPPAWRISVAVTIALLGLIIGAVAILTFSRAGTTVNPTKPQDTAALVTHGIYRLSRNPMYVSLLLYLVGYAAYLSAWPALLVLPAFALYMNRFQIEPEERVLAARFPQEYPAYCAAVRRWL